jgi:hypothetical protein
MPDGGSSYNAISRLYALRAHPVQTAYWRSPHRFNVVPAGRRSGKTELAKRKLVKAVTKACRPWPAAFFAGAPTRDQAKRIFWADLKAMVDPELVDDISDGELKITMITGNELWVLGLDVPARVEGKSWDGCVIDEYGNMKEQAWPENIRPALSDRLGWGDLIGVPEGRNHYYDKAKMAMAEMRERGEASDWGYFHWKSADILPAAEVEAARRELDELTFQQEYEGSFVNFEGRAYYVFEEERHCAKLFDKYNPKNALIFCFDFNVEPGSASVIQEMRLPGEYERDARGNALLDKPVFGSAIIGEVNIPRNSNTPAVCRKLIEDWKNHTGPVRCYGDATGGNRGTAKTEGSDWDLIASIFREARNKGDVKWGEVEFRVKEANPRERSRINAVNTRLYTTSKLVRMKVDPSRAPHVQKDFEGVMLLKGGSGEIDKKATPKLTHWTDGIGYYCDFEFPIVEDDVQRIKFGGH